MTTTREHGTNAKWVVDKCRCDDCRKASRAYENTRFKQIAYGRWEPFVDAEPVRRHVRELMAFGLGWERVACLAGVATSTVEKLVYGDARRGMSPSKRVRPATADKLLAVRPDLELLGAVTAVDATGSHRRLQALVAAGWPQSHLAMRLGAARSNFGKTMRNPKVRASTALAVRGLYEQLWRADPLEHGVSGTSYRRARSHAKAMQWAPVGAWDDDQIDDPQAHPDWTGRCGTPEGYGAHYSSGSRPCQRCRDAKNQQRHERRTAA